MKKKKKNQKEGKGGEGRTGEGEEGVASEISVTNLKAFTCKYVCVLRVGREGPYVAQRR